MHNLITGLIFLISYIPTNNLDNCSESNAFHPVKSDLMLQIVLKSYGYYEGKIDGQFGTNSKIALIKFQSNNNIETDGIVSHQTCNLLLNKNLIIDNIATNSKNLDEQVENNNENYSQEIYDAQTILKDLSLYTSTIDGINGPATKRAIKSFQTKAGLKPDGVLGPLTKSALEKGEESYVTIETPSSSTESTTSNTETVSQSSALDLRNYDPSKSCIVGYVDANGIWVPDPCFKPVFVYRFGNTAQVNSQQELDAYLADRWSLEKEKTYATIGRVKTQNYTDGINSPVNGMIMPTGANNKIVIGIKNDNNVRARPQSGPQNADAVVEVLVEGGMTRFINIFYESDTTIMDQLDQLDLQILLFLDRLMEYLLLAVQQVVLYLKF